MSGVRILPGPHSISRNSFLDTELRVLVSNGCRDGCNCFGAASREVMPRRTHAPQITADRCEWHSPDASGTHPRPGADISLFGGASTPLLYERYCISSLGSGRKPRGLHCLRSARQHRDPFRTLGSHFGRSGMQTENSSACAPLEGRSCVNDGGRRQPRCGICPHRFLQQTVSTVQLFGRTSAATDRLILSLPTPRSRHSQAACFPRSLLYRSLLHRSSLSRPALFFAGGV